MERHLGSRNENFGVALAGVIMASNLRQQKSQRDRRNSDRFSKYGRSVDGLGENSVCFQRHREAYISSES